MNKYVDIEQIKEVIRTEWVKYMPSDLDINLSFVLGKIAEVPTIEVSEDCISKEPNGVWKAKSFHECLCDNCGFIFDIMKCDFLENMKFCPNCGAKMKGADDE